MLVLNSLEITSFRSIEQTLKLEFDTGKEGIIFVEGENRVEPELGSNGAGKSTLWSALTWALFGKTETNLKADTVVNWSGKKQCCVKMFFTLDNFNYVLERTHKPNKLTLNEEVIQQDRLEDLLNIDFASFLYSIYISQFGSKFFDLTPANKMTVFTSILSKELNKWLEYSDSASIEAGSIKASIEEHKQSIATYNGVIESIDIEKLRSKQSEFEDERKSAIEELKCTISEIQRNGDTFSRRLKQTSKDLKETKSLLETNSRDIEELQGVITTNTEKQQELKYTKASSEAELASYNKELTKLQKLSDLNICPTCGQKIPKNNKETKDLMAALRLKITKTENKIVEVTKAQKLRSEKLVALSSTMNDLKKTYNKLLRNESELTTDLSVLKTEQDMRDREIEKTENRIVAEEKKENPFNSMIAESARKLSITKRLRDYEEVELNEYNKKLIIVEYWKKGFKNIRLMVLDESLKELEIHINNNLQSLGMPGWSINLEIESETQKGTLQREFTVLVEAPHGGGKMPLEVWSGGERQRLRLAGTLGLMDFIHNRRGTDWNVEIFDEPSQYLSDSGIEGLLDVLYLRAKRLNKQIIFADQRGLHTYGKFSGFIKVAKTNKGTVLVKG